jgi:hypothetical protein
VILEAISWYRKPDKPQLVPVAGEGELPGRTEGLSEEAKKAIDEFLLANKKTLELLHKAAEIEHSRYPVDLSAGFNALLPHLSEIRDMVRLLKVEAAIRAEDAQVDQAIESTKTIYGVARSLSDEPVLVSQLVRVACEGLGVSAIERIVNRARPADEDLLELGRIIEGAPSGLNFPRSLTGEHCCMLEILRDPVAMGLQAFGGGRFTGVLLTAFKASGLNDKGAMLYLDFMDEFTQVTELPEHERIDGARAIEKKFEEGRGIQIRILRMFVPAYTRLVDLDLRSIALSRAARVGLAVERYRLAEDKLPLTLDELVGEYIQAIPKDPFDGAKLRYIRLEKGYVAYSIGEDGSDDGGKEKTKDNDDNWDITFTVER